MVFVLALIGCGETVDEPAAVAPAPAPSSIRKELVAREPMLSFTELKWDDAFLTNPGPTATTSAVLDFAEVSLDFHELARANEDGFGALVDVDGNPIEDTCNEQDFDAMFEARGKLWLTSHFECTPGAIYLSELDQDDAGKLSILKSENIDFSQHNGVWNPCAGQVSPWGTHLASEEYEPDAVETPTSVETHGWDYLSWKRMQAALPEGRTLRPYDYGWTPEIAVMTPEGDTLVVKHKAPGRYSHEIAYVLPDERTVYSSDDGRGGGWFMFVADQRAQLSSGKLYAARYRHIEGQAAGMLDWVPLGHASDAMVDSWIEGGVTFADMFERQLPVDGACADGFRFVDMDARQECLKLAEPTDTWTNPGLMASRLETRRYAAYLGATTEFEKGEGVTYDPVRQTVYVAFAKVGGRMVEEPGKSAAQDHMKFPANACGGVWAGDAVAEQTDTSGKPIPSDFVMRDLRPLVLGQPIEADAHGNTCLPSGPANPDNITFLPGYDTLMIAEDTKRHVVASLWSLNLDNSQIKRVMVAPRHGEITGLHWIPNLQGFGYLTVAVQHPWELESLDGKKAELPEGVTERDQRSITGYIGPFPRLDQPPGMPQRKLLR